MKFIGLIKAHHIEGSKFIKDKNNTILSKHDMDKVIEYLNRRGQMFSVTMTMLNSLTSRESIGGLAFYTDGYWIWPSYLSHYLSQNLIYIPCEFIEDIINSDLIAIDESRINLGLAVDFFKENFDISLTFAKN